MRKLVLGIVALISVQFAFVTYMMVLQSPMELTNATAPTQPTRRNSQLPRIEHFTGPGEVLSPQPEVAHLPSEPRYSRTRILTTHMAPERAERRPVRYISKPAFSPGPSRSAAPDEFQTVVISYNRKPQTSNCDTYDPPTANTPDTPKVKAKKRSYLAKASPVIKKPWEWIKTFASKLN